MTTPSVSKLEFVAPEFEDLDLEVKKEALRTAADRMAPPRVWGSAYVEAAANLAAHLLKKREQAKHGTHMAGPTTSRSAKNWSMSSAGTGAEGQDARYEETSYGETFVNIRDSLGSAAITTS